MDMASQDEVFVELNDQTVETVAEIEERQAQILDISKEVEQVAEIFQDLSVLVDEQQEHLDIVENSVIDARDKTDLGKADLVKAQEYQAQARKRQCCIVMILMVVVTVIVLSITQS